jgi:hypothetical protein
VSSVLGYVRRPGLISVSIEPCILIFDGGDRRQYLLSLQGERKSYPLPISQSTPGSQIGFVSFSPDGRWLLYSSNETGRIEVYVCRFAGPGAPVMGKRQFQLAALYARSGGPMEKRSYTAIPQGSCLRSISNSVNLPFKPEHRYGS